MKKKFATVFAILCVLALSGCEEKPDEAEEKIIMGYIHEIHEDRISLDEMEWVAVPGERASELGITNAEAPNGFYIYNEDSTTAEYSIADSCVIRILDWYNNYEAKQVDLASFKDILAQRGEIPIPYTFTIEDGIVVSMEEHYIP